MVFSSVTAMNVPLDNAAMKGSIIPAQNAMTIYALTNSNPC